MDMAENLGKSAGVGESYADLHEEDGFAREMRELALSLVMQVPSRPQAVYAAPNDEGLAVGDSITIRLADQSDIEIICALRCAQSVEYWEVAPSDDAYRLFCTQTEAYVRRNLNTHVYFALVEYDGSVVSMSGLEVVDRMPAIAMQAVSYTHLSSIVSGMRACSAPRFWKKAPQKKIPMPNRPSSIRASCNSAWVFRSRPSRWSA